MVAKTIGNPGGLWGMTADTQTQEVVQCVNNSGGSLLPGDVVIMSDVAGVNVTTTTTDDDKLVFGVVLPKDGGTRTVASTETYASGAVMPVCVRGVARVNIAANTIAVRDILTTSTAAKVAVADNAATVLEALGVALEADGAKDANNTVRALIKRG